MRRFPALVLLGVFAAVSACGSTGKPVPQSAPPSAQPPTSASEQVSARPRDLDMDDKKACDLLTADQLDRLKIDRAGRASEISALNATGCTWTVTGASSILAPVLNEGIDAWVNGGRIGKGESVAPVSGFPAITVAIPGSPDRCDLMVDTADDQYLAVAFTVSPSFQDEFPEPCDGARQLAEAAMQNLLK